jgi:hypothetical protein
MGVSHFRGRLDICMSQPSLIAAHHTKRPNVQSKQVKLLCTLHMGGQEFKKSRFVEGLDQNDL